MVERLLKGTDLFTALHRKLICPRFSEKVIATEPASSRLKPVPLKASCAIDLNVLAYFLPERRPPEHWALSGTGFSREGVGTAGINLAPSAYSSIALVSSLNNADTERSARQSGRVSSHSPVSCPSIASLMD